MLTNVLPKDVLDLLLLETAFDNKPACCINRSSSTHFREHERDDVLRCPAHPLADFCDVRKNGLFVPLLEKLRGWDRVLLAGG